MEGRSVVLVGILEIGNLIGGQRSETRDQLTQTPISLDERDSLPIGNCAIIRENPNERVWCISGDPSRQITMQPAGDPAGIVTADRLPAIQHCEWVQLKTGV